MLFKKLVPPSFLILLLLATTATVPLGQGSDEYLGEAVKIVEIPTYTLGFSNWIGNHYLGFYDYSGGYLNYMDVESGKITTIYVGDIISGAVGRVFRPWFVSRDKVVLLDHRGMMYVVNTTSQTILWNKSFPASGYTVYMGGYGNRIVYANNTNLYIVDLDSRNIVYGRSYNRLIIFSQRGRYIGLYVLTSSDTYNVFLIDMFSGLLRVWGLSDVNLVEPDPDDGFVVIGFTDESYARYSISTGNVIDTVTITGSSMGEYDYINNKLVFVKSNSYGILHYSGTGNKVTYVPTRRTPSISVDPLGEYLLVMDGGRLEIMDLSSYAFIYSMRSSMPIHLINIVPYRRSGFYALGDNGYVESMALFINTSTLSTKVEHTVSGQHSCYYRDGDTLYLASYKWSNIYIATLDMSTGRIRGYPSIFFPTDVDYINSIAKIGNYLYISMASNFESYLVKYDLVNGQVSSISEIRYDMRDIRVNGNYIYFTVWNTLYMRFDTVAMTSEEILDIRDIVPSGSRDVFISPDTEKLLIIMYDEHRPGYSILAIDVDTATTIYNASMSGRYLGESIWITDSRFMVLQNNSILVVDLDENTMNEIKTGLDARVFNAAYEPEDGILLLRTFRGIEVLEGYRIKPQPVQEPVTITQT